METYVSRVKESGFNIYVNIFIYFTYYMQWLLNVLNVIHAYLSNSCENRVKEYFKIICQFLYD